jgi:hypothetical protein
MIYCFTRKVLISLLLLTIGLHVNGQKIRKGNINFYVSPSGNDNNPGTFAKPFASIFGAQAAIRKLSGKQNVIINFRKGKYVFDKTCLLTDKDSGKGKTKVIFKNYNKEMVGFNGGLTLSSSLAKPVTDQSILSRLPENSANKVVEIDLKQANVTDYGKMIKKGFGVPVQPAAMEVFINKQPLEIAKWPNEGKVKIGKVYDRGSRPRSGDKVDRGAKFSFDFDRAKRWSAAKDMWIYGYFSMSFSDSYLQIDTLDLIEKTIRTKQPDLYSVYSSDDSVSGNDISHGRHLRGYYVYNLLEEIDMPGEYFIDQNSGKLYFYPPFDLNKSEIEVSVLETPFIQFKEANNMVIDGITFENARGMAIHADGTQNVTISNCTFRNLGTIAISTGLPLNTANPIYTLDGGPVVDDPTTYTTKNFLIANCHIYNTGAGGVILDGGDRKTLSAANNQIFNSKIHHFNRLNKAYKPAVYIGGVGNSIRNCYIYESPHLAINVSGNNHIVEYNHLKGVVSEASDQGAIYIDRNPSARGTVIRYNYFEEIYSKTNSSTSAIFLDDFTSGIRVVGNVFYKAGNRGEYNAGTIKLNGGTDNVLDNNLFIECPQAYNYNSRTDANWKRFITSPLIKDRFFNEVDINSPIYSKSYPSLKGIADTVNVKIRTNYSSNTVTYKVPHFSTGTGIVYKDTLILNEEDPGFVNYAKRDFRLKPTSIVFKKLPGFKPIPFEKIGLTTNSKNYTRLE